MIPGKIFKEDPVIEIRRKSRKTILLGIALIVASVYGVLVWIDIYFLRQFPEDLFDFCMAFCLPFFIIISAFLIKKMFDKRPAVTLSPQGITNYSNFVTSDLIKWNEIERFEFVKVRGAGLIYIFVTDVDHFIRQASGISFIFMKMGSWISDTPITISTDTLDCSVNDLMKALNYKLEKYKHTV